MTKRGKAPEHHTTHTYFIVSYAAMFNFSKIISLFISLFHKGKYANEKKDGIKVMHIENFTKPFYRVFPTDLF